MAYEDLLKSDPHPAARFYKGSFFEVTHKRHDQAIQFDILPW
jgi:hypothetical protein